MVPLPITKDNHIRDKTINSMEARFLSIVVLKKALMKSNKQWKIWTTSKRNNHSWRILKSENKLRELQDNKRRLEGLRRMNREEKKNNSRGKLNSKREENRKKNERCENNNKDNDSKLNALNCLKLKQKDSWNRMNNNNRNW